MAQVTVLPIDVTPPTDSGSLLTKPMATEPTNDKFYSFLQQSVDSHQVNEGNGKDKPIIRQQSASTSSNSTDNNTEQAQRATDHGEKALTSASQATVETSRDGQNERNDEKAGAMKIEAATNADLAEMPNHQEKDRQALNDSLVQDIQQQSAPIHQSTVAQAVKEIVSLEQSTDTKESDFLLLLQRAKQYKLHQDQDKLHQDQGSILPSAAAQANEISLEKTNDSALLQSIILEPNKQNLEVAGATEGTKPVIHAREDGMMSKVRPLLNKLTHTLERVMAQVNVESSTNVQVSTLEQTENIPIKTDLSTVVNDIDQNQKSIPNKIVDIKQLDSQMTQSPLSNQEIPIVELEHVDAEGAKMLAELQQQLNQLTQAMEAAQKKQQQSGNKIAVVDTSLLADMDELAQQLKQLTQWLNRQSNNSATATNEPIVSPSVVLTQLQQLLVKISDKTEKQPSGNYLNQVTGQPQANNQDILSTEMRNNIASREIPTAVDLKSATNNEPVVINQKTSNDIASMNTAVVSDVLKPQVEHKATSDGAELSLNQQEQPVKLAATIVSGSPQSSVSLSTLTDVTQSVNQATVDNTAPQTSHEKMIHQQQMQQKLDTLTAIETVAVSRKEFVDDMKTKVMVMIQQKIQQADIQLDPPELGKMHVRVHMHNEQAVVNFVVQTPQAKDALEQQMARLRDQLQQAGVDIGDTNVAQQQQGERNFSEDTTGGHSSRFLESSVSDEEVIVYQGELHNSSATGIDYYA